MEEIADIQNLNVVGESKQYIVIKLDDEYYGIDISYVDNIVRNQGSHVYQRRRSILRG